MRFNSLSFRHHNSSNGWTRTRRGPSLLLPYTLQDLGIPPLPHIRMTLDTVPQRRFTQRGRHASLPERKLDIVQPLSAISLQHLSALLLHVLGHLAHADLIQILKGGVPPHALEEGDGEAGALARGGGKDPMRGAHADALCQGLETLADGDDQGAGDRGAVDPFA